MNELKKFFFLKGSAVYKVLYLVSAIFLILTIFGGLASLYLMLFGHHDMKYIGYGCFIATISSFVSCLFMFGLCYIVYVIKTYIDPEEDSEDKFEE